MDMNHPTNKACEDFRLELRNSSVILARAIREIDQVLSTRLDALERRLADLDKAIDSVGATGGRNHAAANDNVGRLAQRVGRLELAAKVR